KRLFAEDKNTSSTKTSHSQTTTSVPKIITWFNQRYASTQTDFTSIRNGTNCFLYLDEEAICKDGFNKVDFDKLKTASTTVTFNGKKGLKKIEPLLVKIRTNNQVAEYKITHELKIHGSPARVLCIEVPGDAGGSLYIGCIYLPEGLHTAAAHENLKKSLISKTIELHLPRNESVASSSASALTAAGLFNNVSSDTSEPQTSEPYQTTAHTVSSGNL
ncbi:MAG: hypothetical protein AB7F64_08265, partial [Gammaproteobacteria bacterium]